MAVLKFGAIVTAARGRIGGHFFSGGQGGATLATNGSTIGTSRPGKKLWGYIKRNAEQNSQSWRNLTNDAKLAWEADAPNWPTNNKVGDPGLLRGYSHYMQINGLLAAIGASRLSYPGAKVILTPQTSVIINTLSSSVLTISGNTGASVNEFLVIRASPSVSAGLKSPGTRSRNIAFLPVGTSFPYDLYNEYIAVFGAPTTNATIHIEAFIVSTKSGQKGQSVFAKGVA